MQQTKPHINRAPVDCMRQARAFNRYELKEVITFSCGSDSPLAPLNVGMTENVSTSGILFITAAEVEVGSRISLALHLHSLSHEKRSIKLRAQGVVLRVEPVWPASNKVAAQIRFQDDPEEGFLESTAIQ
jgi:PilZ domain